MGYKQLKSSYKTLVIAEERALYEKAFSEKDLNVEVIENAQMALNALKEHKHDLLLCDTRIIPTARLKEILDCHSQTLIIFLAPYDHLTDALHATTEGAWSYLSVPFSMEAFEILLGKAFEHLLLKNPPPGKQERLIAESLWMKHLLEKVEHIAKSHASVFLSGESGTGKEVIAHVIHNHSPRALQPFIKVNCAAIPAALLESEFFGHEKGAFTGAIQKKLGRFELANGGTLLLDEISEISLDLQPKLLRAIQEMEFERVGGTKPIHVDVRLISTSNRSMKEMLEQKLFREDLFYRLNVVPVEIPPLREHKEDILPLCEYFLEQFALEHGVAPKILSSDAKQKLLDYNWPGNIREVANVMERALVSRSEETILADHLGIEMTLAIAPQNIGGKTLKEMERQFILETLAAHASNRSQTAKALGISIRTLRNKLNEYSESS